MRAAAEPNSYGAFDAAILVKRYGSPLYSCYMLRAIRQEDLGRLRFALSQGQEVSGYCYEALLRAEDAALLNEVLLGRKASGCIPEADRVLIERALRRDKCHPNVKKM